MNLFKKGSSSPKCALVYERVIGDVQRLLGRLLDKSGDILTEDILLYFAQAIAADLPPAVGSGIAKALWDRKAKKKIEVGGCGEHAGDAGQISTQAGSGKELPLLVRAPQGRSGSLHCSCTGAPLAAFSCVHGVHMTH